MTTEPRYDVAIIGGGPAGLATASLACSAGFRVAVVEKEPEATLAAPAPDGRDIALTHRSIQILEELGAWHEIPAHEIAPIQRACVRNGASDDLLRMESTGTGREALGYLVANHVIRGALYRRVRAQKGIDLVAGIGVRDIALGSASAALTLASGARLEVALIVAADSRFSEMRRKAGIGADMCDFGRVCIVCRMRHEKQHDATAYEWFDFDQTLAVLPLNDRESSIVLTLDSNSAPQAMGMSAEAFAADVERRFHAQWGRMELSGDRHAYPLVAVYAHRFHAYRFALAGDAAVGMHPVTAHGFNFGLKGASTLVGELRKAASAGQDIGAERVLAAYGTEHRRATYPLYMATNALVGLYTDNRAPARFARTALLKLGNTLFPIKNFLMQKLTEIDEARAHG